MRCFCCDDDGNGLRRVFLAVLQRVSIVSAGEQKVVSGEDILHPAWWGFYVYSLLHIQRWLYVQLPVKV